MPKVKTTGRKTKALKTEVEEPAPQKPELIVFKNDKKRVVVPRPKTYQLAIDFVRRHFPQVAKDNILLKTNQLEICDGHYVVISSESWDIVTDSITLIEVSEDGLSFDDPLPVISLWSKSTSIGHSSFRACFWNFVAVDSIASPANLTVKFDWNDEITLAKVTWSTRVHSVLSLVADRLDMCPEDLKLTYDGARISPHETFGSIDVEDGDTIYLAREQRGGKPVIYLYSPVNVDASVQLSLIPQWRFSAIYPVVPAVSNKSRGQQIEWNVRTHQDGCLTETNTGLKVSYLFWEAETDSSTPPSPPSSPALGQLPPAEYFNPLSSDLEDADSVVLASSNVTPYLDRTLEALGLHTEARTSFITYWLPAILKHEYIALRFVPQASYERAAPLNISPQPDVVTRVFMLFRGVREDNLSLDWPHAQARAEDDVAWWKGVVGVDLERASDPSLFRVLEWGGMEVKR